MNAKQETVNRVWKSVFVDSGFSEQMKESKITALQGIGRYLQFAIVNSITTVQVSNGRANGLQELQSKLETIIEYCKTHNMR